MTTSSALRRASSSAPSAPRVRARRNAATVFSGACRRAPRWAHTPVAGGETDIPACYGLVNAQVRGLVARGASDLRSRRLAGDGLGGDAPEPLARQRGQRRRLYRPTNLREPP